jgi:uncharacterized iron-regulated membrane protein
MRNFWVNVHLVLGLTFGVLGIFIGISGSILIYDREIDAWMNPQRYAVSGSNVALAPGQYLNLAAQAAGEGARGSSLRLPHADGLPVVAFVRREGERAQSRVYMDPPTGRVLEISQSGGLMAWMHTFHGNFSAREYRGREIVGAVGIGMLISSVSGLYLWWPGRRRVKQGLGLRPGFSASRNLHYQFGFYGSLVLAMLSFTGIFVSYSDAGCALVGWFSPLGSRAVQAGEGRVTIGVDDAVQAAQSLYPGARVTIVGLPAGRAAPYRITLSGASDIAAVPASGITVFIDPVSGKVLRRIDDSTRTAGDRFLVLQRTMHEGEAFGEVGKFICFVVGLLPLLFVITGTLMWLRKRRAADRDVRVVIERRPRTGLT